MSFSFSALSFRMRDSSASRLSISAYVMPFVQARWACGRKWTTQRNEDSGREAESWAPVPSLGRHTIFTKSEVAPLFRTGLSQHCTLMYQNILELDISVGLHGFVRNWTKSKKRLRSLHACPTTNYCPPNFTRLPQCFSKHPKTPKNIYKYTHIAQGIPSML